jgi:parvulin-like peptidyl-prolyl isomerase
VSAIFGPEFAQAVFRLDPGGWNGPIKSGFGVHLVKVIDLQKTQPLPFAATRSQLMSEWQRVQEQAANEKIMNDLRKKYRIVADDSVKPIIAAELANANATP